MDALIAEKLSQAEKIVAESGADVWLTFDRETAQSGDPVLPFLISGGLTWQSALMITRQGQRIAVLGNYDADPLRASGHWQEVIPYVKSIREPLLEALERVIPADTVKPRIAVNFSVNDEKADGLSHGMYLLLEEYLSGTRFEGSLVSAESMAMALRSRKTATEVARMRAAIAETVSLFAEVETLARIGMSERAVYDAIQERVDARGLGYAWDKTGDPIVNSGPDSMIGHGTPSAEIVLASGHIFHIDLGVVKAGYSSDMQRCWYIPAPGESSVPDDAQRALEAVVGAITAGVEEALRPGVPGWQADAAARAFLVAAGYPEYQHAFGHQVGRAAHDGGGILGPPWQRYGHTPFLPVEPGQVYTAELGVEIEGRGYLGIEEMVLITEDGCEWLTDRQRELPLLK